MDWIVKNGKKLLVVIGLALGLYLGVVYMIPGNQGEAEVGKVKAAIEGIAEKLPDSPAE